MKRDGPMLGTDKEWQRLRKWLKRSQVDFAKLPFRRDPVQALEEWESERSTLVWAISMTPATTGRGQRVKALAQSADEIVRAALSARTPA